MKEKKQHFQYKWQILSIIFLIIWVDLAYVYYYYKKITFTNILSNFVIALNYTGEYLSKLINIILNEEIIKIIAIGFLIIYGIDRLKLVDSIKQFTTFEFKDFKMKKEKLEEDNIDKIETIPNKNISMNDNENKEIIEQLFIDCPFLVSIVDSYVNRNFKDITINLNIIPEKIKLEQIGRIFEYRIKSNTIIIKSMKKDIEATVIDVFKDFESKGIIYVQE